MATKGEEPEQVVVASLVETDPLVSNSRIPTGAWRDGFCDCLSKDPCSAINWMAFCCGPIALGQVMQRMGLDWTGSRSERETKNTCKTILVVFIICMVISFLLRAALESMYEQAIAEQIDIELGDDITEEDLDKLADYTDAYEDLELPAIATFLYVLDGLIRFFFALYILVLMIKTRAYIRNKYRIPQQCCTGCEDCCLSFWCGCCTITQMARHTADYDTHQPACCTETGLPSNAPAIV